MKKESIKKVLKYRPPIYISLMIIAASFFLFLYISVNHKSYAIETNRQIPDRLEINMTNDITSEDLVLNNNKINGVKVYEIYSDGYQNFSLNSKYDYGKDYNKDLDIKDSGIKYILANSYPNKNLVDEKGNSIDSNFQTWITQTSIWLYMYEKEIKTKGSITPENEYYLDDNYIYSIKNSKKLISGEKQFKTNDTIYNTYIKPLVNNALNVKDNNTIVDYFKDDKIYSTKNNKYYQTSEIKIITNNSENFKNYKISLKNAPNGTKIVDEDGKIIKDNKLLDVTDSFYIRVPKSVNINNDIDIKVVATAVFDEYEIYSYKQEGYNDIIVFNKKNQEVKTDLNIKF